MEKKEKERLEAEKEAAKMSEEDKKKWDGVPDWKRKILEEKVCPTLVIPSETHCVKDKKEMEKNAPAAAAKKAEEERQAKLAAMPEWKRNLALGIK
jgi:hypothetical protein